MAEATAGGARVRARAAKLLCDVFRGAKPDVRRALAKADAAASFLLLERSGGDAAGAAAVTALSFHEAASLTPAQLSAAKALGALLAWPRALDAAWRGGAAAPAGAPAAVYVSYVGVVRWRRRRGLGLRLLRHALGAHAGCAWLESRTLDEAHSLYLRAGFAALGVVAGLYGDGPWGDATLYHHAGGACTCGAAAPPPLPAAAAAVPRPPRRAPAR